MKRKIFISIAIAIVILATFFPIHIEEGNYSNGIFQIGHGYRMLVIGPATAAGANGFDYTCDGIADEVQWQAILNDLPGVGGQIQAHAGAYNFTAGETVTRAIDNVSIIGVSTAVSFQGDGVTPIFEAGGDNWLFSNFLTDAGGLEMSTTSDWMWLHVFIDTSYYPLRTDGINIEDHSSLHGVGGGDTVFPTDPNADKYLMWDDDPGQLSWEDAGTGSGDMLKSTYDTDEDGDIDTAAGGTEWDSSAATGVAYITAGAWGTRATGISNTYILVVDGTPNDDEYARFTASGLEGRTESEFKQDYNLEIGTDVQAYDAELAAIAGLTSAADKMIYFTGSGTAATSDLTAFARSILDDADEATFKATVNLEIGTDVAAQTHASQHGVGGGDAVFPVDPNADKYLMWDDDPGQLSWEDTGTGDMHTSTYDTDTDGDIDTAAGGTEWDSSAATGVAYITGGSWSAVSKGIADTNFVVIDGNPNDDEYARFTANGLEGRTEAEFKADFNLEIGTDVLAYDATLDSIADLGTGADKTLYTTGVDTWAETGLTAFARSILDDADEGTFKATTNLEAGTDYPSMSTFSTHESATTGVHGVTGTILGTEDVDDTPVDGATTDPVSSNWAYDHENDGSAHQSNVVTITFLIDGGGSAITTGEKGHLELPFACTITGWTLLSDQSGSMVIDVWKDTYANFPPTVADTIAGSEKPTLSSVQKNQDLTLSTWTTAVSAGDILAFNVDSASTVERVTLSVRATKT